MRTLLLIPALATVALVAVADDNGDSDVKKFQGKWVLASGEKDGEKLADAHVKASKITWKGMDATLLTPHQSKEPIKAKVTLDASKTPKQMTWVRSAGPGKGKKMHAIYEFTGDESYRVCFAPPGKERPTEFATKAGTGHTLHVWKREKAKKQD